MVTGFIRASFLAAGCTLCALTATAETNIEFEEVGSDVQITISGFWNSFDLNSSFNGAVGTSTANYQTDIGNNLERVSYINAATDFTIVTETLTGLPTGSPFANLANISLSGTLVSGASSGFFIRQFPNSSPELLKVADQNYVAGTPFTSVGIFSNQTLASMNLPAFGSGVWDLVSVGGTENISWNIVSDVVPEPSAASFLIGCATLGLVASRRTARR